MTAAQYEANLEANLLALLERIKSGRYVAPPVRRVYIPKADGSERPLGIPTFEDKVAQRAIVMVLEPIYEQEFLSCSFGFRPGRSAHQALTALRLAFMGRQGLRWVLDVDISKYYDTIQHHHLRAFLDRRVTDGVSFSARPRVPRKAALPRLCSQTSTYTMCWMNGSSGTCACASKGTASSCGTPMTA